MSRADARILILGSLPSERSVAAGQYYAHPQNAFWRIMGELVGASGDYVQRCEALVRHGIALWDVLAASVRPGSMDADIRVESAQVNDFNRFFREHPDIRRICFNGRKAEQIFLKFRRRPVVAVEFVTLPSTSPAYASMRYDEKLERWRRALAD